MKQMLQVVLPRPVRVTNGIAAVKMAVLKASYEQKGGERLEIEVGNLPGALMGRFRGLKEGDPMTDVSDDSEVNDDRAEAAVVPCVAPEEAEDVGAIVTDGGRML